MSNVSEGIIDLNRMEDYDDAIEAEVIDVIASANYSTGKTDINFMYETPVVTLVLDTSLGTIFAEAFIRSLDEANMRKIISNKNLINENDLVKLQKLIGETIYLETNDDFYFATLWPDNTPNTKYEKGNVFNLRVEKDSPAVKLLNKEDLISSTELRSVEWLNRHLTVEYERLHNSNSGWLERKISKVTTKQEEIHVEIEILDDWNAIWSFKNTFRGKKNLRDFATETGLPTNLNEMENSIVYLHPLRNISNKIVLENSPPFDRLQRWVLNTEPLDGESSKKGFFTRIWEYLNPREDVKVSVSVGQKTPNAKSADTYDIPDQSRIENTRESYGENNSDSLESELPHPTRSPLTRFAP